MAESLRDMALPARIRKLEEDVELAWGIIANVSNGDWSQQTQEWQNAAISWRDGRYIGDEDEAATYESKAQQETSSANSPDTSLKAG